MGGTNKLGRLHVWCRIGFEVYQYPAESEVSNRMCRSLRALYVFSLSEIVWAALACPAAGDLLINEVFIDPPGSETSREYIEFRGTPNMALTDYFLIIAENEDTLEHDGETGQLDAVIDLSSYSLGSNGFLVMRRAGNPYSVHPDATDVNLPLLEFENSGGTYMVIRKGSGPTPVPGLTTALDGNVDNDGVPETLHDGMDYPGEGQPGWTIVDQFGIYVEVEEVGLGRSYASINFGPESDGHMFAPDLGGQYHEQDHREADAIYVPTGYENEVIARYGNSTGQTARDWHLTNVTDNGLSGYDGMGDFRQAAPGVHGYPRPDGMEFESNQYVPYGTNITGTLGAPNFPLNQTYLPWDFNHNGTVDAADYTIWRNTLGQLDGNVTENGPSLVANADRDGSVDATDYEAWKFHFGESLPLPAGAGSRGLTNSVPEPASWLLVVLTFFACLMHCRR
jgi:hypothetical protein